MDSNNVEFSFEYKSKVMGHLRFELPSGGLLNDPKIIGVVHIIPGINALVRVYKVPYEVIECEAYEQALDLVAQHFGIQDGSLSVDEGYSSSTRFIIIKSKE